ncbi:MAG: LytR C-terminal domain-containing protein [Gemmatimonadales bacterium]
MRARVPRVGLIAGITVLALAGIILLARRGPDRIPGHAYAIPSGDDRVIVEVLNGTRQQGLARRATRLLREHGIDVVFFATGAPTDSTTIILRRGSSARAAEVRRALGTGRIVEEPDTLRRVDATVVLGQDFTLPEEVHP